MFFFFFFWVGGEGQGWFDLEDLNPGKGFLPTVFSI